MRSDYLKSRVGRRLFTLFLLAALAPLLLMAFFSYSEVSHQLVELNKRWLHQEAKTLGMNLVARLRWRAVELKHLAATVGDTGVNSGSSEDFRAFTRLDADKRLDLDALQRSRLERGDVVLKSDEGNRLSMLVRMPGGNDLLQGDLNNNDLWHDADMDIAYCVSGKAGEMYYCSPEISQIAPQLLHRATDHAGEFTWGEGEGSYLIAYWRAPLEGLYANPGFTVVMALPKTEVLGVLARFRQVFAALTVLAFAVAVWLTLRQLRRQMRPLDELAAGAQRLAGGDFETSVDIHDGSEFDALANSFNLMSRRLRQKFHMLGALGELDRAILSSSQMDYIIDAVLQQSPPALSCDMIGILQLNGKTQTEGCICIRPPEQGGEVAKCDVTLDQAAYEMLCTDRPCFELLEGEAGSDFLHPMFNQGIHRVLIFPALTEGRASAAFLMGFRERPEEHDDLVRAGRSFADRLALASSNIAWEEKLYHQAHYDALTDLPNRVLLHDRVDQAVNRARRENSAVALMLIDLDHFKEVNDSLGHSAGDELLVEYAADLVRQVRESDTVARLGGDEFVVLLSDLARGDESRVADEIASKLQQSLTKPISVRGEIIRVQASIGIALFPDNGASFEALLKAADAAMYESKRTQRGSHRFYSEELNGRVAERFHLAQELRLAFEKDEFLLHYQPKLSARTGLIEGAEALVRWRSPTRGLVPPGQFIPVIDDIGFGSKLGEWVLHAASAQLSEWDRLGLPPIKLSVNISPIQFHQTDIVAIARDTLSRHGLAHKRIELEILEATAVEDSDQTRDKLRQLRENHFDIALDDFGTGYSSLVYLTRLPVNVLKLDREFIRNLSTDPRQASIVAGIISLAKGLGMQIIAEGVEEMEQWKLLRDMKCDLLQGYLFSRPVPADEFREMLEKGLAPRSCPASSVVVSTLTSDNGIR